MAATLLPLLTAAAFGWENPLGMAPLPPSPSQLVGYPTATANLQPAGAPFQKCSLLAPSDAAYEPCATCESCYADCCDGCGSSLKLGGWIQAGIYANAYGTTSNGPLGFNDLGDGFKLHQAWVYAEKAVDTGGCGWDWGYRADVLFGVDGPDTQAFGGLGWDNGWDTSDRYGFALPQLYAEVGINDLTIKAGHFFTLIGSEVVPAPDNFFFSHSYTMYYGEPFTHTGVLASYACNDNVTVHAGWTQGWDTGFDNTPHGDTFLGGISLKLTDNVDIAWMCTGGTFGPATANKAALGLSDGGIYMNSIVLQWTINDRWTYIFQHDLGVNSHTGADSAEWYGINQYVLYKLNDCWSAGMRIEWFRDEDGARISYNGTALGSYNELTWGLRWTPRERLIVRPELRYDWFDGTAAAGELPFDNGNASDQFSGGFDIIWTF